MSLILSVDDDDAARYTTSRVLRQAGFQVQEAASGAEALAFARRVPDLVLLDIRLPDMSGLEVCRRLKQDPATAAIPILHLTATYGASSDQAAALEGGADAYLTQPVEPTVLVATIKALLRIREAEARARRVTMWWQSTFDALGEGVALLDREARYVRCNVAMARLMNQSAEALVGQSAVPALPGAAEPPDGWPAVRAVQSRKRESCELVMNDRWFEVVADPVMDEAGAVTAVVRTVKDITDRKKTEARVAELLARAQAAWAEAEQANRLKDEFLATLSHELRTPLNAIIGWAHVLRAGEASPETTTRAMEAIARNAHLQGQLISDILDVSRIIAGKLRLDLRPTDLADVIAQAVETVRPAADAKGIRLESLLDPAAESITGDPSRLQQVVWNLLSNAIKFTPSEGRVQVRLGRLDNAVRITVEDNGPGMDPSFLPYAFERFRQADASKTRRHKGLGLGLAIVRHLVEMHGGTVTAANREDGPGALFQVMLPRRLVAEEVPKPEPERSAVSAEEPTWLEAAPSLAGITVLVVDDEADARGLLEYVLSRCGARVIIAASAEEALESLRRHRPDVLLADVEMPVEDGYALIRRVRDLPAEAGGVTPAAALTAYAGAQDRIEALRSGFQFHVAKPVQPAELATVVATLRSMIVRRV
jgi:PAS domain S-box-containing protein